jgi:uncharacterized protein (DUF2141 family)
MHIPSLLCAIAIPAWVGMAQAADLTITITGAGSAGEIRAMLFDNPAGFDKRGDAVASFAVTPRNGQVTVMIANLPPGTYAVATFQDQKGTQQLDTDILGIPTEPYGFSNDARGLIGPPGFDQAAFPLETSDLAITIRLR